MSEHAYMRDDRAYWAQTQGSHGRTLLADVVIRAQLSDFLVQRVLGALEAALEEGAELPW